MALLTRDDLRRQSRFAWLCLAALPGVAVWLWALDRRQAAIGTLAATLGCAALLLPPRERMAVLPGRLRRLPRRLDAAPVLAALLSTPGYGLGWFYGANPYDEIVHLLSGVLAGAAFAGLLLADGRGRGRGTARVALAAAGLGLGIAIAWEVFEAFTGLIGNWLDTWSDIALTLAGAGLGGAAWCALAPEGRAEGEVPPCRRAAAAGIPGRRTAEAGPVRGDG